MKRFFPNPPESFESYRAARQVARLSTICAVVLGMVSIALAALVVTLFPLKEIQPLFVTFRDKGDQVVRIEPIERSVRGLDQLIEGMARQYVHLRETFDLQTERERWAQVALMSSEALATVFRDEMNPAREGAPLKRRMEEQATRSVRIVSSTSLTPVEPEESGQGTGPAQRDGPAQRVYQVEWVSEDRHKGEVVGTEHWQTTMTVCLEERAMDHENQYINPIGFTVIRYTVARKSAR